MSHSELSIWDLYRAIVNPLAWLTRATGVQFDLTAEDVDPIIYRYDNMFLGA